LDKADLIENLRQAARRAKPGGMKTIVRLKSAILFERCVAGLARLYRTEPGLRKIRPLPLIRALSCPFVLQGDITRHPAVLAVERDEPRAAVHGLFGQSPYLSLAPESPLSRQQLPWGVSQIKAPLAWKRSTGSKVKIGVIDTGIDVTHPDLRQSSAGGINLVQRNLFPYDDNGHGTHISGTIAASSRRSGLVGVAPEAAIYAVKAFDRYGTAYVSDIVSGIEWCIRNRMDVINMSFGMKTYSESLEQAVLAAYRAKITVVASSGNDGKRGYADYPAQFPQTVSVGATTKLKTIAPFSNRGRLVDIYAPGKAILSTWPNGSYHEMSGTSMATSHVSGVIALMLSLKPGMSPKQIKSALLQNATILASKKPAASPPREVDAYCTVNWALARK
jgi:subtilisin